MTWDKNPPDVESWQPHAAGAQTETLRNALMITCQFVQARIVARVDAEIKFNLQNFDSGWGVEEIVREELASLLPNRYSVSVGHLDDREGRTAGECDLIVRDPNWSPVIKPGATSGSRKFHFPIEGVYAVTEIKQTLTPNQLDQAMRKLVMASRLERPRAAYGHITENQHILALDDGISMINPLHTAVFAIKIPDGSTFDDVVERFGNINAMLNRRDMVKMLCVLGHGTAWYSVESGRPYNATYMQDRREPLIMQINRREPENAFYRYFVELMGHLNRSVLGLYDVMNSYGDPPPYRETLHYQEAAYQPETVTGQ